MANYFYRDVSSEWLCLKMTRATLESAGITLKFEDPSPVGNKKALSTAESGGERFPHLYGGIPPAGVVVAEYPVRRSPSGAYVAIDGLCEADARADAPESPVARVLFAWAASLLDIAPSKSHVATCAAGVALGLALARR